MLGNAEQATAKLKELESIGVDQFNIYLMTKARRRRSRPTAATSSRASLESPRRGAGGSAAPLGRGRDRLGDPPETVAAVNAPVTEALVAAIEPAPADVVLDLAAGTGDLTEALSGRVAHVISTDLSPAMVEAARRRRLASTEHRVMDMQAIDLPDASVDAVVCRFGYMLVPDLALALRETRRVLRPGGGSRSQPGRRRSKIPGRPRSCRF